MLLKPFADNTSMPYHTPAKHSLHVGYFCSGLRHKVANPCAALYTDRKSTQIFTLLVLQYKHILSKHL